MLFNVDDITGDGLHFRTQRQSDWVTNIPELVDELSDLGLSKDIDFDLTLTKIIREVSVTGHISFGIRAKCARCLDNVQMDLHSEVNFILTPRDETYSENDEGDLDHDFYDGDTIDISGYLRELIAINIPFNIICDENCKGLCSNCGINLNKASCDCEKNLKKSAFAVLKDIKL